MQVLPALDAGGVERTAVDVAAAVAAAGGTSLIASAGGRLEPEAIARGIDLRILPLASKNPRTVWANAAVLARIVREQRIEILHARSRAPAWSAWLAARRTGAHFVTTYAGIYKADFPGKRLYNAIMARGEIVIANSQFTAAHIRDTHKVPAGRIVVIPRGIDLRRFAPEAVAPEAVAQWRSARGLQPHHWLVLLPGRITRWKGHAVLIEAAAQLRFEGARDIVYLLAGDPQGREGYLAELNALIAKKRMEDTIRLIGHESDMALAYAAADVIVAPSLEPEAFGRVPVEAMAMGKLCIASDLGAPRETIKPGETGLLVPAGDAVALAGALRGALSMTEDQRTAFAWQARRHVAERFSVEVMCAATLRVYQRVLGHG